MKRLSAAAAAIYLGIGAARSVAAVFAQSKGGVRGTLIQAAVRQLISGVTNG